MLNLNALLRGLALFLAVFLLTACGIGKDSPVGKWVHSDKDVPVTVEFAKDKTFLKTIELSAGYRGADKDIARALTGSYSGKWKAMDDDRIVVTYDIGGTEVYQFEGKSLVMKKNGNIFKKVN